MKIYNKIVIVFYMLIVIISLSDCSNNKNNKSQRFEIISKFIALNKLKSIDNVFAFNFRGWSSLDDSHLIVDSGFNRNYLLKLEGYCSNLSYAINIKLYQGINNRLQTHFDSVSVINQSFPQKCRIKKIYLLTNDQKNELNKVYKQNI